MLGVGVMVGVRVGVGVGVMVGVGVGVPRSMIGRPLRVGSLRSSSMTETAKPMLLTGLPSPVSSILEELTPMTSPASLTSGPPLLPGFSAASVWSRSTPCAVLMDETMPLVTVMLLPILSAMGKPSASTSSPMRTASGLPAGMASKLSPLSMRTSARSRDGHGATLPPGQLPVEFNGVSFSYTPGVTVLRDLSLRLEADRTLGLLGRTGSGKTTMSRLLFRFYDPNEGSVRLGETDIRELRLEDLRNRVGLVTQEVQLFQATVRDNLTLFDPAITDDAVVGTLESLGLGDWYRTLPNGLDSEISAGGGQLSAGESQLLAFARVFLKDPDCVILDEASSRLDPATEALLQKAVDRLLEGRTALVIAQRLATVERVDEIVVIDNGRILEHGERDALAGDPSSHYSRLLKTGLEEALA